MNKYTQTLDMNSGSHSCVMLLKMIVPNSSVLEFGPATGYMTQYMKEELNCNVFIVEFNPECYAAAKEYADGGFLGDIEIGDWEAAVKGKSFDYILFSDVLEHLRDPEQTLKNAHKHLKYDGRLLLSVPNISHSSILIDLLSNKFNYSPTGLLDNTHLKYFTYDSLVKTCEDAGFFPVTQKAIYAFPFHTEFQNHYRNLPGEIQKIIAEKLFGTVYQFIFECVRYDYYVLTRVT